MSRFSASQTYVIAGFGRNPQGRTEGFVVLLPEPGTLTLLAVGGLLLLGRNAKSRT